tara:strand:- start:8939 stop:10366 length:1428 start_codon:yes stop_codon:yes gene_type:complete
MKFSKIKSKTYLNTYLENNQTVKDELIKPLIIKIKQLCNTGDEIASVIVSYRFFGKIELVLNSIDRKGENRLLKKIIRLVAQRKDIETLSYIDKRHFELEEYIVQNIYKEDLELRDLFNCVVIPESTSKIREIANKKLRETKLNNEQFISLINSLNSVLYLGSSLTAELGNDLHENYSRSISINHSKGNSDRSLLDLRSFLICEYAQMMINQTWALVYLSDLIIEDDLKELQNILPPNVISWFRYENKLKQLFQESTITDSYWVDEEEINYGADFNHIWDLFIDSNDAFNFEYLFNIIKLKILYNEIFIQSDLDFLKLLNHTITANYIKVLYDLGIITKVPNMGEIISWPEWSDVKNYFKRFDADLREAGPFEYIDYRVGKSSSLSIHQRQQKLRDAFLTEDFTGLDNYDMGLKGSPKRLQRISKHLIWLIRNAHRKSSDMTQAISDWENDLEFLRNEFYDDKCAAEFLWSDIHY